MLADIVGWVSSLIGGIGCEDVFIQYPGEDTSSKLQTRFAKL